MIDDALVEQLESCDLLEGTSDSPEPLDWIDELYLVLGGEG